MNDQPKLDTVFDRVRQERGMFEFELSEFVRRWGPRNPYERIEFQQHMLRLMTSAMHSQSATMAYGIEFYASHIFLHRSLEPLHVIMQEPKRETKP